MISGFNAGVTLYLKLKGCSTGKRGRVIYLKGRQHLIIFGKDRRVCQEIGQGEKIFDTTNLTLHLQPNVLFRHRVLGLFGAGDLVLRTGGPHAEVFEWPNVLFVRSRLKRIEHLLQSREVLSETA